MGGMKGEGCFIHDLRSLRKASPRHRRVLPCAGAHTKDVSYAGTPPEKRLCVVIQRELRRSREH